MKTQLKAALNVMFIGSIFSGFMLVSPAQAVEAPTVSKAKTLLYISPAEYNYSVRLLQPLLRLLVYARPNCGANCRSGVES